MKYKVFSKKTSYLIPTVLAGSRNFFIPIRAGALKFEKKLKFSYNNIRKK